MRIALVGDTMLGRGVAARLRADPRAPLVSPAVAAVLAEADLAVANLECCISERGTPANKRFTFRAPPVAARRLAELGITCATLANNHAADFGGPALLDTLAHLRAAGVRPTGAGAGPASARAPALLQAGGMRVAVFGVTDHPVEFAAGPDLPGVAYADLAAGVPAWLSRGIAAAESDAVLVSPHWGPNMTTEPLAYVRAAAAGLVGSGATLVAGHSAHVFHGVEGPVAYDLGDFVDDYARDPVLRNDLGVLVLATVDHAGLAALEAVPLHLDYCYTSLASGEDAAWVRRRFRAACEAFGTRVEERDGRLAVVPG